ncbi:neutral zinc metallopeptidase [Nocardia sp. NPDC127579]|uniref:neutral zinc metallopeptidase n=1 Tax=Nocardia sp. NPDC127579 TaxID=3345402 RepID=UPI0036281A2C
MNQPPYGHGPIPPGGQRFPGPGYRPQPPGYPNQPGPGYRPSPGYGPPQGFPAVRPNQPPARRPPIPPPLPYGPSGGAPRPPRRQRGGGLMTLLLAVVVLVVGGLVLVAVRTGDEDKPTAATDPGTGSAGANSLLTDQDGTLLPAECAYTQWSTDVETARTFFETAATCLHDAWEPLLAKQNLSFEAPTLNVSASTEGITTPCTGSTSSFAAFYCPANKTIYMPISQLQTEIFRNNWVVYLSVFAHEYGHHVQAMSGILRRANAERVDAGVRSARGLELSRRVELQAQCFNGMYLGSSNAGGGLSTAQMNVAQRDANGRGDGPTDARDHGTAENSGNWFEIGVDKNRTFDCNTFTAPAASVS